MQVRRCAGLLVEPREIVEFDLESLLEGGSGLRCEPTWVALAPHLGMDVALDAGELVALGAAPEAEWVSYDEFVGQKPRSVVDSLIAKRLLATDAETCGVRERDDKFRARHWRKTAATAHYLSRWKGVDAGHPPQGEPARTLGQLIEKHGLPPRAVREMTEPGRRIALVRPDATETDALLNRRATCRNFDTAAPLARLLFDTLLHRVLAAQATAELAPGALFLKKNTPSGGGLHPYEAYLIVQHVEGLEPGLYHFHPVDHALEPMTTMDRDALRQLATTAVAGQYYLADAPVLVVLAARFERTFWKYRDHDKAYRAIVLEAGHISQLLYVTATELGLGAFITAAINEVDIEAAFGLDPLEEGPIAVCGFGVRHTEKTTVEFDPLGLVWPSR